MSRALLAAACVLAAGINAGCAGTDGVTCLPGSDGIVVRVTVEPDPSEPEPSVAAYPVFLFDDVTSEDMRTTTDADGCAVFDAPAGTYRVEASRDVAPCDWFGADRDVRHDGGRTDVVLRTSCARVN